MSTQEDNEEDGLVGLATVVLPEGQEVHDADDAEEYLATGQV
jgi:hypothetical protein